MCWEGPLKSETAWRMEGGHSWQKAQPRPKARRAETLECLGVRQGRFLGVWAWSGVWGRAWRADPHSPKQPQCVLGANCPRNTSLPAAARLVSNPFLRPLMGRSTLSPASPHLNPKWGNRGHN